MIYLTQHHSSMTEIEKTDFSVKIVVELCLILYKKHTDNETDTAKIDELKKGKLRVIVLIMDNPDILRTSVTMLNDILKKWIQMGMAKFLQKNF